MGGRSKPFIPKLKDLNTIGKSFSSPEIRLTRKAKKHSWKCCLCRSWSLLWGQV